jgi:hypothetical protein
MARELKNPEDLTNPANWQQLSSAEEQAYALAVVRKQAGCDDEVASKTLAELSGDEFKALVHNGRAGKIDVVRGLLGLDEPQA